MYLSSRRVLGSSRSPRSSYSPKTSALPSPEEVAEIEVEASQVLRTQAESFTAETKEQSSALSKASTDTIRERVKVTEKIKQELQDCLSTVDEEVENLDDRLLYLSDILDFEQKTAEQVRAIMRQRKSRIPREAAKDEVDHALKSFYEELKSSLFSQLASDCKKYRRGLNKMRPELDHNIEIKSEAARLDLECLNVQPTVDSGDKQVVSPSRRSPQSRGQKTAPSLWRSSADDMIRQTKSKVNYSGQLRKKLDAYIERRNEVTLEEVLRQRLITSLEGKLETLAQERDGAGGLAECLDEVRADMESNQQSLEELKGAISEHAAALEVAQMRLRTRDMKPVGERVRDQADLALEEEEEHLMRAITKLHIQRKRVTANFDRLMTSEKELERAIAEKESCLEADEEILAQVNQIADDLGAVLEGRRE